MWSAQGSLVIAFARIDYLTAATQAWNTLNGDGATSIRCRQPLGTKSSRCGLRCLSWNKSALTRTPIPKTLSAGI